MKKKLICLIIMVCVFTLPVKVFALTGSVSITCNKTTLNKNETTTCTLKGTSNVGIAAVSVKVTSDSGLTISNFNYDNSVWSNPQIDGNEVTLFAENDQTGTFNIVTFDVKSGSNTGTFKIQVSNIIFVDGDSYNDNSINGMDKSITVSVPSSSSSSSSSSKSSSSSSSSKSSSSSSSSSKSSSSSSSSSSSFSSSSSEDEPIVTPSYSSNVPSGSTNIIVNPPTGNSVMIIIISLGVLSLGYAFWYKNKSLKQ